MPDKVLLVDDDVNLLDSYRRTLKGAFPFDTAAGGSEALLRLEAGEEFAVIVSDLRMPGLDGIQLLTKFKTLSPDTIRILLTGHADLEAAIEAVNKGDIFRFLRKPCAREALSEAIKAGLEQHRLVSADKELHALRKLKAAMEGIITGFSSIVEARDPYTAGHQKRVTRLSVAMAGKMGLEEERITALRMSAMVHDIGKIYVPSEFLNKPGKLSPVEFDIVKAHPVVGRNILKSVDFEWPLSQIVAQHHERMDGSGYPEGLSGEDILLEARTLAVADVVDAISSHRPYRPSLGLEMALKEIDSQQGVLYDPVPVKACLALFREDEFLLEA